MTLRQAQGPGAVVEAFDAVDVIRAKRDGHELDTGFRPRRKADTAPLTDSISTLIGAEQK